MERGNADIRITWIGLVLNLFLGAAKTVGGWALGSTALIADGMHSFLDLLSDIVVLLGLGMARRPEDANHHYGHHKYISLAKLFIGGSVVFFSGILVFSAVMEMREPSPLELNAGLAMILAIISIVVKEILFWWTRAIGRRMRSDLILANAWHHRVDSVSSVGVAVALGAVFLGGASWEFLDVAVTMVLGCYLIYEGARITLRACADLLDAAPEREIIEDLREHILPTPGAVAYHDFRVRRVGDFYELDLHLQVDPEISVDAGHAIARDVKRRMLEQHPEVTKVLIHVEPAYAEHVKESGIHDMESSPSIGSPEK